MVEKQFGIQILPTWHGDTPPDSARYIPDVRKELDQILKSHAGRALAASMRFHNKLVYLMPYEGQDCNAQEAPVTKGSQTPVVLFTPSLLRRSPCDNRSDGNNATLPHEILFHELVHAFRRLSGKMKKGVLIGRLRYYRNSEEFLAVTLTNIFISDATNRLKTGLRDSAQGHGALEQEFAGSMRFFRYGTPAFRIISDFCDDNRGFAGMLSQIRASFNPIAAYFRNRQKAFELAAQGDSEAVFQSFEQHPYTRDDDGVYRRFTPFPRP
jgi:hypothetical protein